ncbi:DHH family phosphoesterase [Candidatus Uhrbacteria bacterium]|nr:DHH family phosphoesterase [Candidatus Uhrbacteria bacterium]
MVINPQVSALLEKRGIPSEGHDHFLFPSYDRDIHDPFLFDDMPTAVDRLCRALKHNEHITIYGDYDVDGVSGAVLLYDVLTKAGGIVSLFFNHREDDGYGLHCHCIERIAEQGTRVLISTDCGIANAKEIAYANTLGIDTIITDHHTPPERSEDIPDSLAIIHPRVHADRYPWKLLSGGGSAFKLAQGLCRTFADHEPLWHAEEKWLLDLVAISTLADCVPLLGENRALVHYGLKVIKKTRRPGLRALLARVPKFYQSSTLKALHFGVIPLLNAASRMEHATYAANVLIAPDDASAGTAADLLVSMNLNRQRLTQKTIRSVPGNILLNGEIFLAASPHWRVGVLGLAANRLLAVYDKPIVLVRSGNPSVGVARSTKTIHIAKTFHRLADYFDRFGGHRAAGGFALKSSVTLDEFAAAWERISLVQCEQDAGVEDGDGPMLSAIDTHISHMTQDFIRDLFLCAPWGPGNPEPRLRLRNCKITDVAPMGTRKQWMRIRIEQDGSCVSARAPQSLISLLSPNSPAISDIICAAEVREWRGANYLSLTVDAIN